MSDAKCYGLPTEVVKLETIHRVVMAERILEVYKIEEAIET